MKAAAYLAVALLMAASPAGGAALAPGAITRILFVGTSLTANASWPEVVAREVASCRNADPSVARIATPGATSAWGAAQSMRIAAAAADIVVVEFLANDAALHRGVSLSRSAENHRLIIEAAQAGGARAVLLVVTGPVRGIHRILRYFLDDYAELYAGLEDRATVWMLDTRPLWPHDRDTLAALIPDGLHPTGAAMERYVGQAVARRICSS